MTTARAASLPSPAEEELQGRALRRRDALGDRQHEIGGADRFQAAIVMM